MVLTLPIIFIAGCALVSWPLGRYLAWAMGSSDHAVLRRLDRLTALVCGNATTNEQGWSRYALSILVFNIVMFLLCYLVLTAQGSLPLNPDGKAGLSPDLAFSTAASFTTNTNLQHYSGEQQLSYLSQLVAIMWTQFVSAATGLAALAAICRALAGRATMGNALRDLSRATFLVLLPLSIIVALALVACGVPMTLEGAATATTLEGAEQTIARGPVAAVVAIKQIGTNGGGYFGPNSTHPFENPSFVSNIIQCVSIMVIPMACVWMFGRIIGSQRQAVIIFGSMLVLYAGFVALAVWLEQAPAAALDGLPVRDAMNLEGKELRFGEAAGPLWAVTTTSTSNGSVNSMHDSLNPLTGMIPMIGMWLNVEFGGVGVGFINMFLYVVTAVFLAGMMVGRTPEYLGRKIEAREMKLALIALLMHPLLILGGVALFASTPMGTATIQDQGPHGLSEIVYEFSSAAANNGSGFEGLGDNTRPWNIATGVVMLFGRFVPIICPLAIAGLLSVKKKAAVSAGTFRTDSVLFGVVLLGVVLIVGALLFMPLAVLGPVAEHMAVTGSGGPPPGETGG